MDLIDGDDRDGGNLLWKKLSNRVARFVAVSLGSVLSVVLPSSWLDMLNSFFGDLEDIDIKLW